MKYFKFPGKVHLQLYELLESRRTWLSPHNWRHLTSASSHGRIICDDSPAFLKLIWPLNVRQRAKEESQRRLLETLHKGRQASPIDRSDMLRRGKKNDERYCLNKYKHFNFMVRLIFLHHFFSPPSCAWFKKALTISNGKINCSKFFALHAFFFLLALLPFPLLLSHPHEICSAILIN